MDMDVLRMPRRAHPWSWGRFHGLEWILGSTYEFSCGYESAGKITGLKVRDDKCVPLLVAGSNFARFIFLFWHIIVFPHIIIIVHYTNS